jgi:isoleucyl-tRNA synthetase
MTHNPEEKKSFKDTLNLPHTDFPIRSNPAVEDEILLKRWAKEDLFYKSFIKNEGNEKFILHDGPPYANGHIHLGHAYNKILKDIIGKSQRMSGKHVPITPGWDCHGLPIELKVVKEFPELPAESIKQQCRLYANKWIEIQKEEFKKLGILMNWAKPYLTMNYHYEAQIVRAFGSFFKQGYIEKKNKTVAWCMHDRTVLATAEIEYKERKDPSIYVQFSLEPIDVNRLVPVCNDKPVSILVWTTTPWTLPLNRAVLLKPNTSYDVLDVGDEYIVVGAALSENICALKGIPKKIITTINSDIVQDTMVKHPFIASFKVPLILDHSVSLEDGTAAVHCAPGVGPLDYEIALKHNLEIFSPISPDGKYTVGINPDELEGMSVIDGQIWVIKKIAENGSLFFKTSLRHSYPHCWRCHEGLIFRATNQWFCSLSHDGLRERAVEALDTITFLPEKSSNYLRATISGRLEWCLSRQRIWGVPIPALLCSTCNYVYTTHELIEKVAQGIEKEGVEYWDTVDINDLGIGKLICKQCHSSTFTKEKDILDVWFDSGISHYAVLYNNPELAFPADIYVEGVDQHRGWFQSSFLTSLVLEGEPSMKAILTHGFTVDERGQKMSKSIGNVMSPDELIKIFGTDGLRLWASAINYTGDAVVSETLIKNVSHVIQKIRNTCRFLLANIYDFDIEQDALAIEELLIIDQYALEELYDLNTTVQYNYIINDFTAVFHALSDYCTVTLSSRYLDIIKDRLYTDKADGKARRSAQTACWIILDTLTKLMAPILSFTAEQLSDYYQKNKAESIHLQNFNELESIWKLLKVRSEKERWNFTPWHYIPSVQRSLQTADQLNFVSLRKKQWSLLLEIRSALLKALELQREKGIIKHSLEAHILFYFDGNDEQKKLLDEFIQDLTHSGQSFLAFLKEFMIVSQITQLYNAQGLDKTEFKGLYARVEHALGTKCPRCWQWEVTDDPDGLCKRCQLIVKNI